VRFEQRTVLGRPLPQPILEGALVDEVDGSAILAAIGG
jgi:hypothetical protein